MQNSVYNPPLFPSQKSDNRVLIRREQYAKDVRHRNSLQSQVLRKLKNGNHELAKKLRMKEMDMIVRIGNMQKTVTHRNTNDSLVDSNNFF